MKRKVKRKDTLEMYDMARKLGIELEPEQLQAALGDQAYADAVSRCKTCGTVGECQFFLEREASAASNKQWWAKEFCPSAKLLLRLAEERS